MKSKLNFTQAFLIVALVFGFASCAYDEELQPPKRVVDANAINQHGELAGKTVAGLPSE